MKMNALTLIINSLTRRKKGRGALPCLTGMMEKTPVRTTMGAEPGRGKTHMKQFWWIAALVVAIAQTAFSQLVGWSYNTPITCNTQGKTGSSQLNFPVLIRLTSSNAAAMFNWEGSNNSSNPGGDLRFTHLADANTIPYQICKYNQTKQTAYIWVKADSVPVSGIYTVRMWWGNAGQVTTSNGPGVFVPANGFVAVWHLDSAGVAVNGKQTFNDATGNGYMDTGTTTIVDSPSVILDSARALNKWLLPSTAGGQGDSIYITSLLGSPGNGASHSVTFSAWEKLDSLDLKSKTGTGVTTLFSLGNNMSVEIHGGGDVNDSVHGAYHSSTGWNNQPIALMGAIHPSGWKHIAYVVTSASATADTNILYVNGALGQALSCNNANSGVMVYSSASGLAPYAVLGADVGNTTRTAFFGELCEARVENVRRSPDWLKLSYENEQPPSSSGQSLDSVTSVENYTNPSGQWQDSMTLTLNTNSNGANITSTVSNFPVLVRLTTATFTTTQFGQVAAGGADIRFAQNGASLPYQIQRWDATRHLAEIGSWRMFRGAVQRRLKCTGGMPVRSANRAGRLFSVREIILLRYGICRI